MARPPRLTALVLVLAIAACSQPAEFAAPGLEPQFGSPRDDGAYLITTDAQRGRVYLAGNYSSPYAYPDRRGDVLFFRRHDRDGRFVWKRSANREVQNRFINAVGTGVDKSGNVYFGWNSTERVGSSDYVTKSFITKHSPAGARLYRWALPNTTAAGLSPRTVFSRVAMDSAGSVYMTFYDPDTDRINRLVRKYSNNKLVWETELPTAGLSLYDLAPTPDGFLYITGSSFIDGEGYSHLIKLRATDGALLADTTYGGGMGLINIAVGSDGIYLQGDASNEQGSASAAYKIGLDGTLIWARPGSYWALGSQEYIEDVGVDAHDNVYLVGTFQVEKPVGVFDHDYFIRKYNSAGDLLFDKRIADSETDASGYELSVASPDEFYIVGLTNGKVNGKNKGGYDAFLMRFNGRGQKVWER